jgi:CheY-like chemotaxis protein
MPAVIAGAEDLMTAWRPIPSNDGPRIVICDFNAFLHSVTGLLRMTGYAVFQAHDAKSAVELCAVLPDIRLLVVTTYGTGLDVGEFCQMVRATGPALPILHIGSEQEKRLPADVRTLSEVLFPGCLLLTVEALMYRPPRVKTAG